MYLTFIMSALFFISDPGFSLEKDPAFADSGELELSDPNVSQGYRNLRFLDDKLVITGLDFPGNYESAIRFTLYDPSGTYLFDRSIVKLTTSVWWDARVNLFMQGGRFTLNYGYGSNKFLVRLTNDLEVDANYEPIIIPKEFLDLRWSNAHDNRFLLKGRPRPDDMLVYELDGDFQFSQHVLPLKAHFSCLLPMGEKTLVIGENVFPNPYTTVALFDHAGQLDPNFGTAGKTTLQPNNWPKQYCHSQPKVDDQGRIYINYITTDYENNQIPKAFVVRLLANGRLDPSFGKQGYAEVKKFIGFDAIYVDSNTGETIVLGYTDESGEEVLAAKIDEAGVLDTTFADGGYHLYPENRRLDDDWVVDFKNRVIYALEYDHESDEDFLVKYLMD